MSDIGASSKPTILIGVFTSVTVIPLICTLRKIGVRSLFGSAGILLYFRFSTTASCLILLITTLLTRMSSTTPPLPRVDLMRIPRSVPSNTQLEIVTLRTLPLISLPITTPTWPESMVQLVMVIFSQGTPKRRACASLPDLIVMQSSPTDIWQSLICTLRQDSGLTPSVFGEGALSIVIPFIITLSQNSGFTVQKGELIIFTPSIFTFLQRTGWINGGRKKRRCNVVT